MVTLISRRWIAMLALASALLGVCMTLLIASPPKAHAGLSPYCNNILYGPWGACWGEHRQHYATYGWGDEGRVCVWSSWNYGGGASTSYLCSSGAGAGVYNPYPETYFFYPGITNQTGGYNRLHGVAYTP